MEKKHRGLEDITGKRYGRWVVLGRGPSNNSRSRRWLVKCDCGTERILVGSALIAGRSNSCGCWTGKDITGKRYGSLLVVGRDLSRKGRAYWFVKCDCGEKRIVAGTALRQGNSKSCGCLRGGVITHGKSNTPTYSVWAQMKKRCLNPNATAYKNYGGRGVTVCDRWRNSFENFLRDMGGKPEGMGIERCDNEKEYSPENCTWATAREQNNNKRNNRHIIIYGVTYTIANASRQFNIPKDTLLYRINRGREPHDAIFNP